MSAETSADKADREAVRFDTKVAMRYLHKSKLVRKSGQKEAIVTNMSSNGILFQSKEKLFPGQEIQVRMLLGSAVVSATGKVARCTPSSVKEETCYETALTFTEISDNEKEKITSWYYFKKFHPGSVIPHFQKTQKKPELVRTGRPFAQYRKRERFMNMPWRKAEIKQVSKDALVLSTAAAPEEDEIFDIKMDLPGQSSPIRAVANVTQVKSEDLRYEVTFKFVVIDQTDREKLSELTFGSKPDVKGDSEPSQG